MIVVVPTVRTTVHFAFGAYERWTCEHCGEEYLVPHELTGTGHREQVGLWATDTMRAGARASAAKDMLNEIGALKRLTTPWCRCPKCRRFAARRAAELAKSAYVNHGFGVAALSLAAGGAVPMWARWPDAAAVWALVAVLGSLVYAQRVFAWRGAYEADRDEPFGEDEGVVGASKWAELREADPSAPTWAALVGQLIAQQRLIRTDANSG